MENYLHVLQKTKLFAGIGEDELGAMLGCLGAGQSILTKGILCCGRVNWSAS